MTPRLVEVKRVLYIEGIGGSIDAGTWDKLEKSQRLDAFSHLFLWGYTDEVVVGRIWSSSDGKGRKRYPMIVCAQCRGLPISWIINKLLPRFEGIEQRCVAATSSDQVLSIIESSQAELQQLAQRANTSAHPKDSSPETLAWLADRPEMGSDDEGLLRVLYQINPDVTDSSGRKSSHASNNARHVRVPACDGSSIQVMLRWARFMTAWINNGTPFLMVLPLGQSWVDLLIGDQIGPRVFGIRVMPNKLPLTTDIPYNLDEQFVKGAQRLIAQSRGTNNEVADAPEPVPPPPPPVSQPAPSPPKDATSGQPEVNLPAPNRSRPLTKILIFIILVVVALTGLYFLNESDYLDEKYKVDTDACVEWLKTQLHWIKKHFY